MVNLNRVFLIGNLTRDPELRYTPQGTAVTTLRIAVNRNFKDKAGQQQQDTCFVNVVVWGQMAEVCNQYLQKGKPVFIEGRLQSRSWQNSEGKNRSVLEVVATRVQFMPQAVRQEAQNVDLGDEPEGALNLEVEEKKIGEIVKMIKKKFKDNDRKFGRKNLGLRLKKDCVFCKNELDIDYKNLELIARYISSRGKILSRRISGNCSKHQRKVAKEIKRARFLNLAPHTRRMVV